MLLVILITNTTDLVDLHPFLHQFCDNLCLAGASRCLTGNETSDLTVRHTLGKDTH